MTTFTRARIGKIVFWLSWPMSYLYVHGSVRTRVLVEAEGKILLVKGWYDGTVWSLPGGGIHKGEDPVLSAIREVSEEVSVDLNASKMVDLGDDDYRQSGLSFALKRYGCMLDKLPSTEKQQLEILDIKWFLVNDIKIDTVDKHTWRHLTAWKQLS